MACRLLVAASCYLLTIVHTPLGWAQDVKGFPGWSQASFDAAWEKARVRHSLPADHPKPLAVRGRAEGTGSTECDASDNEDPGIHDIAIYGDVIKDKHDLEHNSELNSPDMIESVAMTMTHELFHQCLRDAGYTCKGTFDSPQSQCEEAAVDHATLNVLCEEAGEKCQELCDLKEGASDPPTDDEQEDIDGKQEELDNLCAAIEEIREKYNNPEGSDEDDPDNEDDAPPEGWAEQICMCRVAGFDGLGDICPGVTLPPLPDNDDPGNSKGGGPCDYPDGEPVEVMPECDSCEECSCEEDEDEDDDEGEQNDGNG